MVRPVNYEAGLRGLVLYGSRGESLPCLTLFEVIMASQIPRFQGMQMGSPQRAIQQDPAKKKKKKDEVPTSVEKQKSK